jgi:pimeloyl-ACP methyl ester carboxylesterase
MATVKSNGIRIYYEREGKGHPLLLIGGFGCDLSWWDSIRKPLAKHFNLILFENRGCGRTTCPKAPFSIEDMAEDAYGLIDKLGLDLPHVIGQSMGGAIAQALALRYPKFIGKLVLSQTFTHVRPISSAAFIHALSLNKLKVAGRIQVQSTMPWCFSDAFMSDSKRQEAFIKERLSCEHPMTLKGLENQLDACIAFDSRKWVSKIRSQTLILAGEEDYICPLSQAKMMDKGIKKSKLHIFPKMSHNASLEVPDEYVRQILRFLLGPHA